MQLNVFTPNAFHAIMAILCMLVGLGLGFAGYRFQRFAMPACALFIGGDYAASIMNTVADGFTHEYEYWIAFFVSGFAFAGATVIRAPVGVAITGFCAGVVLMAMLLDMAMFTGSATVQILMLTIVGLLVGALVFKVQKLGLIAATSFAGAYVLMDGVRHFVYKHLVSEYQQSRSRYSSRTSRTSRTTMTLSLAEKIRSAWWTMCAISLVLFVICAAVQHFVTARGINHEEKCGEETEETEETDGHQYAGTNTPTRGRGQFAPSTNPVALV